jgi:hypothetical protein
MQGRGRDIDGHVKFTFLQNRFREYFIYFNIYLKHFELGEDYRERGGERERERERERWNWYTNLIRILMNILFLMLFNIYSEYSQSLMFSCNLRLHISNVASLRPMVCKEHTFRYSDEISIDSDAAHIFHTLTKQYRINLFVILTENKIHYKHTK